MAENGSVNLGQVLTNLGHDLRAIGADFALVGGLAVSARAEPRLTRDADVALSVGDDQEAEEIIHRLLARGYLPDALLEQYVAQRLATARLRHRDRQRVVVDLLFASCGVEPEIVAAAEELEVLPALWLPVARTGHLIAMKLLARDDRSRPADADDLMQMARLADGQEWLLAENAVMLITKRGYHRDRDLVNALRNLRTDNDSGAAADK